MSILKITKRFENLDTAFSDLYENEIEFESHISIESREKLLRSIAKMNQQLILYRQAVKGLYIRGDLIGFKID